MWVMANKRKHTDILPTKSSKKSTTDLEIKCLDGTVIHAYRFKLQENGVLIPSTDIWDVPLDRKQVEIFLRYAYKLKAPKEIKYNIALYHIIRNIGCVHVDKLIKPLYRKLNRKCRLLRNVGHVIKYFNDFPSEIVPILRRVSDVWFQRFPHRKSVVKLHGLLHGIDSLSGIADGKTSSPLPDTDELSPDIVDGPVYQAVIDYMRKGILSKDPAMMLSLYDVINHQYKIDVGKYCMNEDNLLTVAPFLSSMPDKLKELVVAAIANRAARLTKEHVQHIALLSMIPKEELERINGV